MSEVFGITGWKNSGKTSLTIRLVEHFTGKGLHVSTVKHAHHAFKIDEEGTDSYRHRMAGAHEVAIVSDKRWALMHEVETAGEAPSLKQMLAKLAPCDLVFVEGFKNSQIPKVETILAKNARQEPVFLNNDSVLFVATDRTDIECSLPVLDINDTKAIADHIVQLSGLDL